jgi:hypothetical protein
VGRHNPSDDVAVTGKILDETGIIQREFAAAWSEEEERELLPAGERGHVGVSVA